jgi:hypothetical protein
MRQPRTSVRGNTTERFGVVERRQVIAFAKSIRHRKTIPLSPLSLGTVNTTSG